MSPEELEALKRDAARYRYLRKSDMSSLGLKVFISYGINEAVCCAIQEDAADWQIDKFMGTLDSHDHDPS